MGATIFGVQRQCDWGEKAWSVDDDHRCHAPAVGVVAVRSDSGVLRLDVCMTHRTHLLEETDPVGEA